MSQELEARFRVSIQGKEEFAKLFGEGKKGADDFRKHLASALKSTAGEISGFVKGVGRDLGSLALGNIGFAAQAKNVLQFRDAIAQLTITAGKGADYMDGLREQIHSVAKASNQMQDDVTEALSAFTAKTGDIETARRNLQMYGDVATATGASIKDVALVGAELSSKLGIKDANEQRKALTILTMQGKSGAVEIRDLANKAPAIFSAASSKFGIGGLQGLRETGALAQVFAAAHGGDATAGMVKTNITQMFTDLQRGSGRIRGILGHDTKGMGPYEILKELIVKTGGDTSKLLRSGKHGVFTPTALAGIGVMAQEFKTTGGFGTFDKYKNVSDDFGQIEEDKALRMSTGASALKASQISVQESSDKNLGSKFDALAHQSDKLARAFDYITKNLALSAGVAGTSMLGMKLGGSIFEAAIMKAIIGGGGGGGGAGGKGSDALGRMATQFASTAAPIFALAAAGALAYSITRAIDQATGGKITDAGADALGWVGNKFFGQKETEDRIAKANREGHLASNESKAIDRRSLVRGYERTGISHGMALTKADNVERLLADILRVQQQAKDIKIKVDKDLSTWTVESEDGTRSKVTMDKRGKVVR